MMMHKRIFLYKALCVSLVFTACAQPDKKEDVFSWPEIEKEHRPWTYWWWMGSAVNRNDITRILESFHTAGLGGVHIIPIYGVRGMEDRFLPYLGPAWMEHLLHTVKEAGRLGMGVDMTTGTGWPFGGPQVSAEEAAKKAVLKIVPAEQDHSLPVDTSLPQAFVAVSEKGETDLLPLLDKENRLLEWPEGDTKLYWIGMSLTGQKVKRAAPGASGYVLDPFSGKSMGIYLARFDSAFSGLPRGLLRSFYNDSYEVYGADWTGDFLKEFRKRRRYDLKDELTAFLGADGGERTARVKCDYRETISDLLLERYALPWVRWSHKKGSLTRYQAHGSPGNLIDLYASADIPETEIFGTSGLPIPGLRIDPDFPDKDNPPDPLMLKFASSAAHITGKKRVSSETCTWLGEHFKVALSQAKPEIDQLFTAGINHIFYHGIAYSPPDEPWPGWLFYASTHFGPTNTLWKDFPELNAYVARCQAVLVSGIPANDILLYFPIHDVWSDPEGGIELFSVHRLTRWMYGTPFHKIARHLLNKGYSFDYISDRVLSQVRFSGEGLRVNGVPYRVLVVPESKTMPDKTLENLVRLARAGADVIVTGDLPADVPGLGNLARRRENLRKWKDSLTFGESGAEGWQVAQTGSGRVFLGDDLLSILSFLGISREPMADHGIRFIRRAAGGGHFYFMTNPGPETVEGWMPLGTRCRQAIWMDPLSGRTGIAAISGKNGKEELVYLRLEPGESMILKTLHSAGAEGPQWKYLEEAEEFELRGNWQVTFFEGGPELPDPFKTETLGSWTEKDEKTRVFAGTARYTLDFMLPESGGEWLLDLGRVCESVRVVLNGHDTGKVWSFPFKLQVGESLVPGKNRLELEVTHLCANRIADMDRKGIVWRKFYDINFVNIKYRPFDASGWEPVDSGLIGPVRLIRMKETDPFLLRQ